MRSTAQKHLCLTLALFLLSRAGAQQNGFNPYQSYDLTDFDAVNLLQGSILLHIPLISYPQRGKLPNVGYTFVYNQPSWTFTTVQETSGEPGPVITENYYYWQFTGAANSGVTLSPHFLIGQQSDSAYSHPDQNETYYLPTVIDSSGAVHDLHALAVSGAPTQTYVTNDGSGLALNASGNIVDANGIIYNSLNSSQTGVSQSPNSVFYMEDPNGNQVTMDSNSWTLTDSIGRVIPNFQGSSQPNTGPSCGSANFPVFGGGTQPITVCWDQLTVYSQIGQASVAEGSSQYYVVSSITLQNGTAWNFKYDSWGEIQTVTTPTGAVMTYQYGGPNLMSQGSTYQRAVSTRTLSVDGKSSVWTYKYALLPSDLQQVTVTDPNNNITTHQMDGTGRDITIQYTDSAIGLVKTINNRFIGVFTDPPAVSGEPASIAELPATETVIYPNGQTTTTCHVYDNQASSGCPLAVTSAPTNYQTYDPNYVYDYPPSSPSYFGLSLGRETDTLAFDYGNGSPGRLLSHVTNSFVWQNSSAATLPYMEANLLNLPATTSVSDATGLVASTQFIYDEPAYESPSGVFGNATSTSCVLLGATSPVSHTVYDGHGMPTQRIDPKNNTTLISYDGTGAYPSLIQYPATNSIAHHESYNYDASTGLRSSHTDENAQKTSYLFDAMRRPTSISYPDGGSESFQYFDVSPDPYVKSKKVINAAETLTVTQTADALGRESTYVTTSDPAAPITVTKTYDGVGRLQSATNPYRATTESTYGVTSYQYDVLGRVTYQCQPDNQSAVPTICTPNRSYLRWTHQGGETDSYDEAGNHWIRQSDALGRLIGVLEPNPQSNAASLLTSYSYDALGNLLSARQTGAGGPGPTRTFTYDSLSRLVCAANPETASGLCPSTVNGVMPAGVVTYGYDQNGNVQSKVDARGIQTNYTYDALNRLTGRQYSFGTDSACFSYDNTSTPYGSGRLTASWTQTTTTCPATPPHSYFTMRTILQYDQMGRIKSEQQCILINCTVNTSGSYTQTYGYDLAGNVNAYSNGTVSGSGALQFGYSYDPVGRLSQVTSGAAPVAIFNVSAGNGMSGYTAFGSLSAATLGVAGDPAGITLIRSYDSRLRVTGETDTVTGRTGVNVPPSATVPITGSEQIK